MTLPQEIVSTATLGTDQSTFILPSIDGSLGDLLGKLDVYPLEAKLLLTVVALKLYVQAGWIPDHAIRPLPEPCALDRETRPCGRRALRHLKVMLEGHYLEALPEWLRELAQQGKRIPEEALPLILDAGRKHEHLRELIMPVIGQRGRWLALEVTNRQWNWFEPRNIERTWDRGSLESRVDLLKLLRQREPARAREMLADSWQGEKATDRVWFLHTLEYGLTMEDEHFLESVLDDAVADVRMAAIHLLSRLPESRFCQRMQSRAASLLSLGRSGLRRKLVLVVKPCSTYDLSMERDGIGKASQTTDMPDSFWRTKEVLRWIAPSFWCEQWQLSLEELIDAAKGNESPFRLLDILVEGAHHTEESDILFQVLLNTWADVDPSLTSRGVLRNLNYAQHEKLAIEMLNTHREGFHRGHPAEPVLFFINQTWSRELSEVFLVSLEHYLQRERVRPDPDTRHLLLQFGQTISLDLKEEFLHTLDVQTSAEQVWREMIDEIQLLLGFRQEMLEAIRNDQ